jgi:RNA polymerase sigma-70 factor (ECF subfamily)
MPLQCPRPGAVKSHLTAGWDVVLQRVRMPASPRQFADVVERHRPEILRYLVRLLGDVEDARDACQEAMLRAHVAFPRLRPDSNPRAWLFRIATNAARNTGRSRTRRARRTADVELDGLPAAAVASPEQREDLRRVARAVDALPPRQRAALMLRRFHGLAYAEIAASVGGTETAARANVYQAVRKLRAVLEDDR